MTQPEGCQNIEPVEELISRAKKCFEEAFSGAPTVCAMAPGRVNLIGEHTDYNCGFVLPMALPLVTVVMGRPDVDGQAAVVTEVDDPADPPRRTDFDPRQLSYQEDARPKWANYVKGVVANFHSPVTTGFQAVLVTSVPLGGGLSSSASLEVAFYTFLEALTDSQCLSREKKALACQKAEHEFARVPCGIMDQFVSVMGEEGFAVKIDCRSMEVESVPLSDESIVVLIIDSNVRHKLTGSEYPTRRRHCKEAAEALGVDSLRDASLADVEAKKSDFASEEIFRRAKHVVTEIVRTEAAVAALKQSDYKTFGKLMIESHNSLRDDFEVSCPEVNSLVTLALSSPGVLGARMTGGGFGGCVVALLQREAVTTTVQTIAEGYGGKATFYVCSPKGGARRIQL